MKIFLCVSTVLCVFFLLSSISVLNFVFLSILCLFYLFIFLCVFFCFCFVRFYFFSILWCWIFRIWNCFTFLSLSFCFFVVFGFYTRCVVYILCVDFFLGFVCSTFSFGFCCSLSDHSRCVRSSNTTQIRVGNNSNMIVLPVNWMAFVAAATKTTTTKNIARARAFTIRLLPLVLNNENIRIPCSPILKIEMHKNVKKRDTWRVKKGKQAVENS